MALLAHSARRTNGEVTERRKVTWLAGFEGAEEVRLIVSLMKYYSYLCIPWRRIDTREGAIPYSVRTSQERSCENVEGPSKREKDG